MTMNAISLRSEADLLALIPVTLGFHPEDSLVLVTLGSSLRPFQARIDLPDDLDDLRLVVEQLVVAAVRNDARQAMVVAYTEDECLAGAAVEELVDELEDAGITVLLTIRADGRRWYPLGVGHAGGPGSEGFPYDVRSHHLLSQSVLEGQVTFRNREELVESLTAADPDTVDEVAQAYSALAPLDPDDRSTLVEEGRWLLAQVRSWLRRTDAMGPIAVARVLRAVGIHDVRDLAWAAIPRADAEAHAQLWTSVVRRSPESLVAPAAGLLAFAAWLSGNGALAWCAVDRALSADPDHTLAQLIGQALERAMPPSSWVPIDPGVLPLSGD